MSPANAKRTTGTGAELTGAAPARAATAASARRLELFGLGMRRVGELTELARDEVRSLLTDVHSMVSDPLQAARDDQHTQAPFALFGAQFEDVLHGPAVGAVDQLVEPHERLRPDEVP